MGAPKGQSMRELALVRGESARIWGAGESELGKRMVAVEDAGRALEEVVLLGMAMQIGLARRIGLVMSPGSGRGP